MHRRRRLRSPQRASNLGYRKRGWTKPLRGIWRLTAMTAKDLETIWAWLEEERRQLGADD
jgi:hypothetical protein